MKNSKVFNRKKTLIVIIMALFVNCDKDVYLETEGIDEDFDISKIKSWINDINSSNSNDILANEFDYNNYDIIKEENFSVYVFSQKNLDGNSILFEYSFVKSGDEIYPLYITKISNQEINKKPSIEYLTYNFEKLIKITLDKNEKRIEFEKADFNNNIVSMSKLGCKPSYGQAVADCIQDAYTNHGWVSVWASVQSAFLPQTAVAIAGACAISEYPSGEECYETF